MMTLVSLFLISFIKLFFCVKIIKVKTSIKSNNLPNKLKIHVKSKKMWEQNILFFVSCVVAAIFSLINYKPLD